MDDPDAADERAHVDRPSARQLMDAMAEGVYGLDREGRCTFINRAALALLRFGSDVDLIDCDMHERVHHTHADGTAYPAHDGPAMRTLSSGASVKLDSELLWRGDGTSFFADYSSRPVIVDGAVTGSVVNFCDLALRRDGRRLLTVQHEVGRILGEEIGTDEAQSRVVAAMSSGFGWDSGALWIPGTSRGGVPALSLASAWHGPEALRHVREIEGEAGALVRRVLGDTGFSLGSWQVGTAPDARPLPGATVAFPIRIDGETMGVFQFVSRDAIHVDHGLRDAFATLGRQMGQYLRRRRVEAELRDSEALKVAIMQTALDAIIVVDEDSQIIEFSPAAESIFGQSRDEAIGQELGALILPADFLVGHLRKFAHFLEEGERSALGKQVQVEAKRADGECFPAELAVTPIKVGGRALFTAYLRDITGRNRAERDVEMARDEAQEANKAKSQFLANMSHELRTPLSAIIGYSEMLQEEMEDGADAAGLAPDMRKIESNARHLLGLINDVLDISKIESGKMEIYAESIDVEVMVRDVASTVSSLVDRKGNRLVLDIAPGLGSMQSDLTKVKQILLNLLSNAAKFTEKGTITLSARRTVDPDGAARLEFTVGDDGIGMTSDQIDKLFQRFTQAETSTASRYGGTGLGLSLSKAFANMLGGDVAVESAYGRGSTFTTTLPARLP